MNTSTKNVVFLLLCMLPYTLTAHGNPYVELFLETAPQIIHRLLPHVLKTSITNTQSLKKYSLVCLAVDSTFGIMNYLYEFYCLGPTITEYEKIVQERHSLNQTFTNEMLAKIECIKTFAKKVKTKTRIKTVLHITHDPTLNASALKLFKSAHLSINEGWLFCKPEDLKKYLLPILYHEAGHFNHNHSRKTILFWLTRTLLTRYLIHRTLKAYGNLLRKKAHVSNLSRKLYDSISTILQLTVILSGLMGRFCLSRIFEFQADDFASKHIDPEELSSALTFITHPDTEEPKSWISSHPPTKARIERLKKENLNNRSLWLDPECYKWWSSVQPVQQ